MKKLLLLFCGLFLLVGCAGGGGEQDPDLLRLYFPVTESVQEGSEALGSLVADLEEEPTPEALVRMLLGGPPGDDISLCTPFPAGTSLRFCVLKNGELTVDLSEHYSRLSEIDLTLADYCITLTLCQLPEVEQVRITAGGRELPYRSNQRFTAEDVLTDRDIWPAEEES